jgi:hypothetical protein
MHRRLNSKHKKVLKGSILLSLCLHAAGLLFLQRQSLWFSPAHPADSGAAWLSSMEKTEKERILKETFDRPDPNSQPDSKKPQAQVEALSVSLKKTELSFPIEGHVDSLASLLPPDPFPSGELLVSNRIISFSLPPEERLNLFEHLPKDLIVLTPPRPALAAPLLAPPLLSNEIAFAQTQTPSIPDAPPLQVAHSESPLSTPVRADPSALAKNPSFIPAPNLPNIPSLKDLQTVSYSDAFEAELVFVPDEDQGYIFALTLVPRPDLRLAPIRQNYFFLIDRSNSIQRERLIATKSAVRKAIEELGGDDTFNIIAFDSKLEKLSTSSLSLSRDSLTKAEDFLDNIELGSFFSQADLFKALFLTIPSVVKEDELYTAILLTDGENLSKKGSARSLLNDWSLYNDGRVALHVVGMGEDPHLDVLEAAAAFNKGKIFTSPTKRGIKRKLLKLMKTIHSPVSKNISCRAIARTPQSSLELLPKGTQVPHLFLNEPYVILGKTNSLDDFILFVQGRLKGEWLHIKKTISFLNAKKGSSSLKAEWALQKAYELYERFLTDNDEKHLVEARSLLKPHDLTLPIE